MKNTIQKIKESFITGILAIFIFLLVVNSAMAWPSIEYTVMPEEISEGENFFIDYTAYGNGNDLTQIYIYDEDADVNDVVTGTYSSYNGMALFSKNTAGTYRFIIEAFDDAGNSFQSLVLVDVIQTVIPTQDPENIRATDKTDSSIDFAWDNPTDAGFEELNVYMTEEVTLMENNGTVGSTKILRSVNGAQHEIEVTDVTAMADSCGVMVDGTTVWIDLDATETVNGVSITTKGVVISASLEEDTCDLEIALIDTTTTDDYYVLEDLEENKDYTLELQAVVSGSPQNWVQGTVTTFQTNDNIPPLDVSNLAVETITESTIKWNWDNPEDLDFSHVIVLIDGVNVANVSNEEYEATSLTENTDYTIGLQTVDLTGNVNSNVVEDTQTTTAVPDTTAPAQISNLQASLVTNESITWTWNNPADADFNQAIISFEGVVIDQDAVTSIEVTGLTPNTEYTISIETEDDSGNINDSAVELSTTTLLQNNYDFTITDVEFETRETDSDIDASLTIENTGSMVIAGNSFTITNDLDEEYDLTTDSVSTLNPGETDTVMITISVPADQEIGSEKLGEITFEANSVSKSADVNLKILSSLSVEDVDIVGMLKVDDENNIHEDENVTIDVEPESKFVVELTLKNLLEDKDIEDITVIGIIQNIDDGDDVEVEVSDIKLDGEEEDTVELEFTIPLEVDDGKTYDVEITAEGVDEDDNEHSVEFEFEVEIAKDSKDLKVYSTSFTRETITCIYDSQLKVTVMNTGLKDLGVEVEAANSMLGLTQKSGTIEIEGDENEAHTFTFDVNIPEVYRDIENSYPIVIKVFGDQKLYGTEEVTLNVGQCSVADDDDDEEEETVVIINNGQIGEETQDQSTDLKFLGDGQDSLSFGNSASEKGKIQTVVDEALETINMEGEYAVVGGVSTGVILIAVIAGFLIFKKKSELLF